METTVVTRRSVLTTAAVGSMALLSGCGLRLDQRASVLPRLPMQGPHPSAALLHAELADVRAAANAARAASGPTGPPLARTLVSVHTEQVAALTERLRAIGQEVPADPTVAAAATSPGAGGPAQVTSATVTLLQRAEAARTAPTDLVALSAAAQPDIVLLAGCRAVRAASAALVGGPPISMTLPSSLASLGAVQRLSTSADALVYGLQVATARVGVAQRGVARASLQWAMGLRLQLESSAGTSAPVPPMGYTLAPSLSGPDAAPRLAQQVLGRIADDAISAARSLPRPASEHGESPAPSGEILAGLVTIAASAEMHRVRWDGRLRVVPASA